MQHNLLTRLTGAIALGTVATTAIVLLMQALIDSDLPDIDDRPPGATLSFLPVVEETPPEVRDDKPVKPPQPTVQPPPPTPPLADDFTGPTIGDGFTPPINEGPSGPTRVGALVDGNALPIVKVQPVYPSRAQTQGIEGYVLVEFTIDELGRVTDIEVLEAKPRGTFERAALKAVERFRYKPRVINGHATPVRGVQHLVTFALDA